MEHEWEIGIENKIIKLEDKIEELENTVKLIEKKSIELAEVQKREKCYICGEEHVVKEMRVIDGKFTCHKCAEA